MSPRNAFRGMAMNEKRRHECCKASNNDEGGREETSRKGQTEVDGRNAERFETTLARPKARTEPRRTEKGSHGDRPPDRDKIGKGTQVRIYVGWVEVLLQVMFNQSLDRIL